MAWLTGRCFDYGLANARVADCRATATSDPADVAELYDAISARPDVDVVSRLQHRIERLGTLELDGELFTGPCSGDASAEMLNASGDSLLSAFCVFATIVRFV